MRILSFTNGWPKMKRQLNIVFCMLSLFPQYLLAQSSAGVVSSERSPITETASSEAEGFVEPTGSEEDFINLLEFIGEFETKDGEWLSPNMFLGDNFNQLDQNVTLNDDND